jgi:phenylacetate-coenzyme A ligase PaaK-like adenylate-forming protein
MAAWQELGYTPHDRLFIMWGHVHLLGTGLTRALNQAKRSVADAMLGYRRVNAYRLNPEICATFAEQLIAFRPVGFISYASALDLFARYTQAYRSRFRSLGLKFVMATTEPPPRPDTLSLLADLFGCPVVQEYGGGEFGQVAFKNGERPFEVYDDLNYVECEAPDEGGLHPLLITSLYHRYVPLVRYRVGDAVTGPDRDATGHVTRFAAIAGRMNDVIALPGGDAIHRSSTRCTTSRASSTCKWYFAIVVSNCCSWRRMRNETHSSRGCGRASSGSIRHSPPSTCGLWMTCRPLAPASGAGLWTSAPSHVWDRGHRW